MTKIEELKERIANLKKDLQFAHARSVEEVTHLRNSLAELEEELRNLGGQQLLIEG